MYMLPLVRKKTKTFGQGGLINRRVELPKDSALVPLQGFGIITFTNYKNRRGEKVSTLASVTRFGKIPPHCQNF